MYVLTPRGFRTGFWEPAGCYTFHRGISFLLDTQAREKCMYIAPPVTHSHTLPPPPFAPRPCPLRTVHKGPDPPPPPSPLNHHPKPTRPAEPAARLSPPVAAASAGTRASVCDQNQAVRLEKSGDMTSAHRRNSSTMKEIVGTRACYEDRLCFVDCGAPRACSRGIQWSTGTSGMDGYRHQKPRHSPAAVLY